MSFFDTIEDLLAPGARLLLDGVKNLFGGSEFGDTTERDNTLYQLLYGGTRPQLGQTPTPGTIPGGPSGLLDAINQAGTEYQAAGAAVALTDQKLADQLKQIFAANDDMRAKIGGIISQIETYQAQVAAHPELAGDPNFMKAYQTLIDIKLAEIQHLLDSAKVDSKKRAELLAALAEEYRSNTKGDPPDDGNSGGNNGGGTNGGADPGGGGGDPVGAGGDPGAGVPGLTDPLAGLGGLPGAGMADPLSMLAPALAGLGSLPGALGGAGSSLPLDALGGLAPLAGLAGQGVGNGFADERAGEHSKPADFTDDRHAKSETAGDSTEGGTGDSKDHGGDKKPEASAVPPPAQQPAPADAVPASAAGDPARLVRMPDGSAVSAPSAQTATAMRAVLNGSSVTDAWKSATVDLPPPGTPVTAPVDPSHLLPGQLAQFKTRDPVMYMGNGKIWLDGQLQPQSTLPTADFSGWFDPTQPAGVPTAPAAAPTAQGSSGT